MNRETQDSLCDSTLPDISQHATEQDVFYLKPPFIIHSVGAGVSSSMTDEKKHLTNLANKS